MDNVYTNTTTGTLDAPPDWDHSQLEVSPLYVSIGHIKGMKCYSTYWVPSPEELDMLKNGGCVEIINLGVQPPMQVNALAIPMVPDAGLVHAEPEVPQ